MNLDKWKSQIVRGTLEYCILLMLDKKVYYGYEILQELSKYPIVNMSESNSKELAKRKKSAGVGLLFLAIGVIGIICATLI